MIGSFEFNGIKSSTFKLACRSVSRPLLPAVRTRTIQIYGKSGIIDYSGGDFETRQIVMHVAYIGRSYNELRNRSREIAAWLSSNIWAKLIINDEPDKYYLARVISGINFETIHRLGQADITFECQPFAYMIVDPNIDAIWDDADFPWTTPVILWDNEDNYTFVTTEPTTFSFDNPGTCEIACTSPQGSKFNIIITGTWTTLEISLNGKTLQFTEGATTSKTLIINNVEMEVKLNGVNKLSALEGDIDSFLSIIPGENIIQIDGTGLNVTVTLDFTPMWL